MERGSQPYIFRSAPDGSVWFADNVFGRLGRIGPNGVLTQRQVLERAASGSDSYHPFQVAVGPDGSVWFDILSAGNGVARLRPDGALTMYPIQVGGSLITVDSHGNAWIPAPEGHADQVVRISDSGGISQFKVDRFTKQLAEGADGRMWFLSIGCMPAQQVGWIDANGQTRLFDAPIVDDSGSPNSVVRAPDGAVWFGTVDQRLIRIASETDVTVYNLPWPDARLGPFVVLRGNHILMTSWTIGFEHLEMLDFAAANGTRVAGIQSIPAQLPNFTRDAAEAAAYPVAAQVAGANGKVVLNHSWKGDHAALFNFEVNDGRCDALILSVYVVEDSGGWHKYDAFRWGSSVLPQPTLTLLLKFQSGCLNVRESPKLGSKVVTCLPSGSSVEIDQLPVYADENLWWHVVSHDGSHSPLGWAVQKYLLCSDYFIGKLPQC